MKIDLGAVHADVCDGAARRNDRLAQFERGRNADGLDGGINPALAGHRHDRFRSFAVSTVDDGGGTEPLADVEAIVIEIDHNDFGGRVELGGQKRRQSNWSRPDDCDSAARLDFAIEDAALETCWQNITEHHQGFFVGAVWNRVEARVGVGDADKFSLGAVNGIAQDPSASRAMSIHKPAAIHASAARTDAGNQHFVSGFKRRDGCPNFIDDAYAFMAKYAAGLATRDVTFEDVKVGAAYRCFCYFDDSVAGTRNDWLWTLFEGFLCRALIDKSFHSDIPMLEIAASKSHRSKAGQLSLLHSELGLADQRILGRGHGGAAGSETTQRPAQQFRCLHGGHCGPACSPLTCSAIRARTSSG